MKKLISLLLALAVVLSLLSVPVLASDTETAVQTQSGPVILRQPTDAEAPIGQRVKVEVQASGDGLTYRWYLRNAGAKKFTKSSVTSSYYDVMMKESRAGRQVYCVITDAGGNSVTTDTVTLRCLSAEKAAIVTQPKSVTVAKGEKAKVTFQASGDGLTYEWYFKNAGESAFRKTSSFTGRTYKVEMTDARAGRQIYCLVTDQYGNQVKTDTVTLHMGTPVQILTQPKSVIVAKGENAKVTVRATGDGLTYTWYFKNADEDSFRKTDSFTGKTYKVKMTDARAGRQIYCVVTDKYGNTVTTQVVTIDMYAEAEYMPTSLTVTLYDSLHSIYGFTYNTKSEPIKPVIQIQAGKSLTGKKLEYPGTVRQFTTYDDDGDPYTFYVVKVEIPLEPDTTYTYRAYDKGAGVGTQKVTFRTRDPYATGFTFTHVSDTQNYPGTYGTVLSLTADKSAFMLHTGDMVQKGREESDWDAMLDDNFQYLSQVPVMAISGNHETSSSKDDYATYKHFHYQLPEQKSTEEGFYYSFIYGDVKFIMLNGNDRINSRLKQEQVDWLIGELENNTCTWTVVAIHQPLYSVGHHTMNPDKNKVCMSIRAQLKDIFAAYGVDLVIQGHDHTVSKTHPLDGNGDPVAETLIEENGIRYTVDPGGVIYVVDGTSGGQTRKPYAIEEGLYDYAERSHSHSWAEYKVEGNRITVTVQYYDGSETQVYHQWGIIKNG